MQKRRPVNGSGAVLLAGFEHVSPTKTREKLKANQAMRDRLEALTWGWKLGVR
ncbi:hypothetical protein Ga0102493_112985 [Erythrobacter litoralis]|uniref:hypothetical protein n=1 Tax=Erythrobacter litoralis TaxID=39960 RepID=UPI000863B96C|nr:hypothetical protein [Erythrobacter litoralis]AOL23983.1 hypothetical protein Ga0102493_112985 [Erythrobacter litoralis]